MEPNPDTFYEGLVRQNYELLYKYALRTVQDPDAAEDLVMDTLHTALEHIDKLQSHQNPGGWLVNVLKNKIQKYLFFTVKEAEWIVRSDRINIADLPASPADTEKQDFQLLLMAIRQTLSPEEYDLFTLHYLDGMEYTQLARRYGITVWACRKRMQRIRERLRNCFSK